MRPGSGKVGGVAAAFAASEGELYTWPAVVSHTTLGPVISAGQFAPLVTVMYTLAVDVQLLPKLVTVTSKAYKPGSYPGAGFFEVGENVAVAVFASVTLPATAILPVTPEATVHAKLLNNVLSWVLFNDARAVRVAVGFERFALITNGAAALVAVLLTLATTDASLMVVEFG